MDQTKEFSTTFFLAPGECDASKRIPLTLLVMRIIQAATYHANSWGVGYDELIKSNQTWVLSRVSIEMTRYPTVNEHYTLTTWMEGFNRHFSERDFAITDGHGNEIGYARTIWVVMDISTREAVDITKLTRISENKSERPCPIERHSKLKSLKQYRCSDYKFKFTDIDFNRHVNSCKYINLLLNQWPLEFHDTHFIKRFEIAYMKEAKYGEEVEVHIDDTTPDCRCEILHNNIPLCRARFIFSENEQ